MNDPRLCPHRYKIPNGSLSHACNDDGGCYHAHIHERNQTCDQGSACGGPCVSPYEELNDEELLAVLDKDFQAFHRAREKRRAEEAK